MAQCSKPSCKRTGAVVLAYDYALKRASLEISEEPGEMSPHLYRLCDSCADRLVLPRGWELIDLRRTSGLEDVSELSDRRPVAEDGPSTAFGRGA